MAGGEAPAARSLLCAQCFAPISSGRDVRTERLPENAACVYAYNLDLSLGAADFFWCYQISMRIGGRADVIAIDAERVGSPFRVVPGSAHLLEGDLELACDRERMLHVFDNLIGNAVQAMAEGGVLRIDARGTGDQVVVCFEDRGPGFSEQALARAGEYFYSEKEGGMGIGLAVAREVVQAHGGRLSIENVPDGARVTLLLPRAGAGRTDP